MSNSFAGCHPEGLVTSPSSPATHHRLCSALPLSGLFFLGVEPAFILCGSPPGLSPVSEAPGENRTKRRDNARKKRESENLGSGLASMTERPERQATRKRERPVFTGRSQLHKECGSGGSDGMEVARTRATLSFSCLSQFQRPGLFLKRKRRSVSESPSII